MKCFTQKLHFPKGQYLGGYASERISPAASDDLEVNGWAFAPQGSGNPVEICSIDALYAGDLVEAAKQPPVERIFASSHTHFAPMIDSAKPILGKTVPAAVEIYAEAVKTAERIDAEPDSCRLYQAEVAVPVYRRFDFPNNWLNRFLNARAGLYPNEKRPINRNLYIFVFAKGDTPLFCIAYHACHPTSRHEMNAVSPDYIGAIRKAVRARFGVQTCLFFLGCSGDIRPNFACKRFSFLPRGRLNWRFQSPSSAENERMADRAYAEAVGKAELKETLKLEENGARLENMELPFKGRESVPVTSLVLAETLRFDFVPFEVSHLFQLDLQKAGQKRFIVSCANKVLGYLPHPSQIKAGGYEVDSSRICMGLPQRMEVETNPWARN